MSGAGERPLVAPEDPADRTVRVRTAVRVIILDRDGHVLLFRDSDPLLPQFRWWVTPGGGIDPGETVRQAAVREVAEETGHAITEADLIGPLAHRLVRHGYSDEVLEQTEDFYAVRGDRFSVDTAGFTPDEQITLAESRWWPLSELATTQEWIWPRELVELIAAVDDPTGWGRDLGTVTDESTRAV